MNESVYRRTFTLDNVHLDRFGRLKSAFLLYFVQEVSADHASALGASWEELAQKNLFWAIIRHRIDVTRMPIAGETLTLETWPMPTTRTAYPRATVAYDEKGQEVFRSVALWVLMDKNTRAMVLPAKSGVTVPGFQRDIQLEMPGSLPPVALENQVLRQVGFSLLDRNGHMNNTRYLDWIDDLLSSDFHADHTPRQIRLCYLSEIRENQQAQLNWSLSEDACLRVEATSQEEGQHRIFGAQIHF